MVARLSPLFELSPVALTVVTCVGAITAFFAATVGVAQNDIKRVVAYSTCSQLGYMFVALGLGAYGAGIFHLFTHAFFKALLFLGAGSVIHALHGEQDLRNMGGLRVADPLHLRHDGGGHAFADRLSIHGRLLLKRCDYRCGLGFHRPSRAPGLLASCDRRFPDVVLLLAAYLHGLLREAEG